MSADFESSEDKARAGGEPTYSVIDVAQLWRDLWERRWLLLSVAVIGASIGSVAAYTMPRYYEGQTTLLLVEPSSLSTALGSLGGLGALASLAGVSLRGGDDHSVEAMALLSSRKFTVDFIREHDLFPALFARKWDPKRGDWKVTGDKVPTDGDAYERFDRKIRRIRQDKKTGVITLTIRWRDPQLATDLANDLVVRLNRTMQARAVAESEAIIKELQAQLDKTDVVSLRQALSEVLESEVKSKTLAVVSDEFALRVVDPAVTPAGKEYVFPKPALFVVGGAMFGLMLGGLLIVARRILQKSR